MKVHKRVGCGIKVKRLVTALYAGALLTAAPFAQAKELKSIGVTVGDIQLRSSCRSPKARS